MGTQDQRRKLVHCSLGEIEGGIRPHPEVAWWLHLSSLGQKKHQGLQDKKLKRNLLSLLWSRRGEKKRAGGQMADPPSHQPWGRQDTEWPPGTRWKIRITQMFPTGIWCLQLAQEWKSPSTQILAWIVNHEGVSSLFHLQGVKNLLCNVHVTLLKIHRRNPRAVWKIWIQLRFSSIDLDWIKFLS